MNIGQLTIYTEGKVDYKGIEGKAERVREAWTVEGNESLKGMGLPTKKVGSIQATTTKDFEVKEHRNALILNITELMWEANSKVQKRGKYIQNLPSRSAMNQYGISHSSFTRGLGKKFNFQGLEFLKKYSQDEDAVARFIVFIEDMVSTITLNPNVQRTDYKIELFDITENND